jgi:hypothetical protein
VAKKSLHSQIQIKKKTILEYSDLNAYSCLDLREMKRVKDVLIVITGFLDFVHRPELTKIKRSRNLIYLCPQVRGWEIPTLLDQPERANLNHRTVIPSVVHHRQKLSEPRTF